MNSSASLPEHWLRGPLSGISPLLQPLAHALLQARDEVAEALQDFPDHLLGVRPAGVASVGFHLRHLAGVLGRMQAYAAHQPLSEAQLQYLAAETTDDTSATTAALVQQFEEAVEQQLATLRTTSEATLPAFRPVGRQALPSTVMGLLTHAAEHTTRHTGQLLVTARIVQAGLVAQKG